MDELPHAAAAVTLTSSCTHGIQPAGLRLQAPAAGILGLSAFRFGRAWRAR